MTDRGRSLAYLSDVPVARVKGFGPASVAALAAAGIDSVTDLLLHTPRRYLDRSTVAPISEAPIGEEVTIIGVVESIRSYRARRGMTITEAMVADAGGRLKVVWFNQGFRARQLPSGTEVALSGKLERRKGRLEMKVPAVDRLGDAEQLATGRVVPIHPTIADVKPWAVRRGISNALARSQPIDDPVPLRIRRHHGLVDRSAAFQAIHFPDTVEQVAAARRRLVYDEFLRIELSLAVAKRLKEETAVGVAHTEDGDLRRRFVDALPFPLTGAQRRVVEEIAEDMALGHPMHRLLQGEVGSGKTVVAVAALLTAVESGHQGAVMAPTEVLATQHYLGITDLLAAAGLDPSPRDASGTGSLFESGAGPSVSVALLTGSQALCTALPEASRTDVVAAIAGGSVDVVVGTHALIQEGVAFAGLSMAVVDEQHRFGVGQRVALKEQAGAVEPDLLIMTATPIPRTLSMTLYGDLDVSLLDEMPPGRSPVRTDAIGADPEALGALWEEVAAAVASGRQAFVVCPLVDESAKVELASATEWHTRLTEVFSDLRVGLIHGQLRPDEKRSVMDEMRAGEIDVLVATTVIEVGIDIPNATLMVILDADRFGLSQLHQLRGRVGRGEHPGRCVLVADPATPDGQARIDAMVGTTDGFALAERDLEIRGQGSVFGERQSGRGDLRLGDILRDTDLLVAARTDAFDLVGVDATLEGHPGLAEELRVFFPDEEIVEYLFKS
jgi:ATP-dependent DNA helicase RecG